jgi:hypothetical protein
MDAIRVSASRSMYSDWAVMHFAAEHVKNCFLGQLRIVRMAHMMTFSVHTLGLPWRSTQSITMRACTSNMQVFLCLGHG